MFLIEKLQIYFEVGRGSGTYEVGETEGGGRGGAAEDMINDFIGGL